MSVQRRSISYLGTTDNDIDEQLLKQDLVKLRLEDNKRKASEEAALVRKQKGEEKYNKLLSKALALKKIREDAIASGDEELVKLLEANRIAWERENNNKRTRTYSQIDFNDINQIEELCNELMANEKAGIKNEPPKKVEAKSSIQDEEQDDSASKAAELALKSALKKSSDEKEAKLKAEEEARRIAQEEEDAKRKAEEEEDAKRKVEEELSRQLVLKAESQLARLDDDLLSAAEFHSKEETYNKQVTTSSSSTKTITATPVSEGQLVSAEIQEHETITNRSVVSTMETVNTITTSTEVEYEIEIDPEEIDPNDPESENKLIQKALEAARAAHMGRVTNVNVDTSTKTAEKKEEVVSTQVNQRTTVVTDERELQALAIQGDVVIEETAKSQSQTLEERSEVSVSKSAKKKNNKKK